LTDLFLQAVTFDAVTLNIVAVTDSDSDPSDDDEDKNKNKYIAVGQAAAVAHN
jgi:hypothetical protein